MKLLVTTFEKLLVTTSAEPISAEILLTSSAKIKARSNNAGPITLGNKDDGQKWPLTAGQELDLNDFFSKTNGTDEVDLREVYIKGAIGDGVLVVYGKRP